MANMTNQPQMSSLLTDIELPAAAPKGRRTLKAGDLVPESFKRRWAGWMADPAKKKRVILFSRIGGGAAAIGLALGLYFWLRPTPQPDYMADPLNMVFDYTFLTDDFNNLPWQERLKLLNDLVSRMRSMDSDDSLLLAAFAAGIQGSAREQLEKNVSKLAIDMWDSRAKDYAIVPEDQREEYLEQTFLELTKVMESFGGRPSDKSDEERLEDVRRQAQRDRENIRNSGEQIDGRFLGRAFDVMNRNVGGNASPQQRVRGQQMMRDMARHFRGQDISTGKPKP